MEGVTKLCTDVKGAGRLAAENQAALTKLLNRVLPMCAENVAVPAP